MRPISSTELDQRLGDNYERLFAQYFTEVQQSEKTGKALKEDIPSAINAILGAVLEIKISSLGNIMEKGQGQLFFEKGSSKHFPYDVPKQ